MNRVIEKECPYPKLTVAMMKKINRSTHKAFHSSVERNILFQNRQRIHRPYSPPMDTWFIGNSFIVIWENRNREKLTTRKERIWRKILFCFLQPSRMQIWDMQSGQTIQT